MVTVRGLEHRCSLGGRLVHPRLCIFAVDPSSFNTPDWIHARQKMRYSVRSRLRGTNKTGRSFPGERLADRLVSTDLINRLGPSFRSWALPRAFTLWERDPAARLVDRFLTPALLLHAKLNVRLPVLAHNTGGLLCVSPFGLLKAGRFVLSQAL